MVRVRYAPSPTGTLHIGGARTALFNYLYAKRHNGRFILRVEDTDQGRLIPGSEDAMISGLRSLGMHWEEGPDVGGDAGPYRQSERLDSYGQAIDQLLSMGRAYRCYCTPEELEKERNNRREQGLPPRYSGLCRNRAEDDPVHASGVRFVVRLKVPLDGVTVVDDLIRGRVTFENKILDDFVIMKSDGSAIYNFAVVMDDYRMGITHVIRGEEHLSNTPKQILAYRALGFPLPQFAHLPMILAPDRSKLSKRHGATSVEEYRDQGILPIALVNYLLLLGWSPPDGEEFMTLDHAAHVFELDRVQHTAAIYDQKKLEWMNAQYLKSRPLSEIVELAEPFIQRAHLNISQGPPLDTAVALVRERVRTLVELVESLRFLYEAPGVFDAKGVAKHFNKEGVIERLQALALRLESVAVWEHDQLLEAFDQEAHKWDIKRADLIHPTRLALTGKTVGPGLFELVEVLGRSKSLSRIQTIIERLQTNSVPEA